MSLLFTPSAPQAQTRRIKITSKQEIEITLNLDSISDLGPAPEGMQSPRPEEKQEKPKRWCGLC